MIPHRPHLSDLDELALTVRDPTSRTYVLEAIADYRAGSYRSAIVATWTAICCDIVAKFRELQTQEDAAAVAFVKRVDEAIRHPEAPTRFQAIERGLLDEAKAAGFLDPREQMDLGRVKEDRNFCAHPAFIADATLFQPTADLARTHIVHAIVHLLQRPPIEGRTAIERFTAQLKGTAFPHTDDNVEAWCRAEYCGRVKPSAMRGIIVSAITCAMDEHDRSIRARALSVLRVLDRIEPQLYKEMFTNQVSKQCSRLEEQQVLPRLALWLAQDETGSPLTDGTVARLRGAIASFPMSNDDARDLFALADHPAFGQTATERFTDLSESEKDAILREHARQAFASTVIDDFAQSPNYRTAESRGERLVRLGALLTSEQLERALIAAAANRQIWDAARMPDILARLFQLTSRDAQQVTPMWRTFLETIPEAGDYSGLRHLVAGIGPRTSGAAVPSE